MRKKSHISLAKHIVDSAENHALNRHRKAFCLGNILPDCKPSFLTTKHEFNETFDKIKKDIEKLVAFGEKHNHMGRVYCRDLGQVVHYIADYFTFPHNSTYEGNLKDHCVYEKELKHQLKAFIKSGEAKRYQSDGVCFESFEELIQFIKMMHGEYLKFPRSVKEDCIFIVNLCWQVVFGVLYLLSTALEQKLQPVFV